MWWARLGVRNHPDTRPLVEENVAGGGEELLVGHAGGQAGAPVTR
jgi:hypothetical protein